MENGIIYKGIGGFYYVKTSRGELVECKPRGILRKRGLRPVAGDKVLLSFNEDETTMIDEILERKNIFLRPPVANIDILFIVASMVEPSPNLLLLDRLGVLAFGSDVVPVMVFTKIDMEPATRLENIYKKSGIEFISANASTGEGLEEIKALISGNLCAFSGNSGVGKSTLINALIPGLERETAEISQKLGRGRHTTREVEIFEAFGGMIADTPGFSSLRFEAQQEIDKDSIMHCFPEIEKNLGNCRFSDCRHLVEVGCEIRSLVQSGVIDETRYKNYTLLYNESAEAERF